MLHPHNRQERKQVKERRDRRSLMTYSKEELVRLGQKAGLDINPKTPKPVLVQQLTKVHIKL